MSCVKRHRIRIYHRITEFPRTKKGGARCTLRLWQINVNPHAGLICHCQLRQFAAGRRALEEAALPTLGPPLGLAAHRGPLELSALCTNDDIRQFAHLSSGRRAFEQTALAAAHATLSFAARRGPLDLATFATDERLLRTCGNLAASHRALQKPARPASRSILGFAADRCALELPAFHADFEFTRRIQRSTTSPRSASRIRIISLRISTR